MPISVRAHIEHVTMERDQYKAQVERFQAEAALAQAQYGPEAHARIQGLEAELQEYENLRIATDVTFKLSERLRQALEAKLNESEELKAQSEAKVKECEGLKTEAQAKIQALQNAVELKGRSKVYAPAQFQESERLRIQAQEDLEAYKSQTQEELVAKQMRCSELEKLLIDVTVPAQATFVENQALQQAFVAEQTKFKELEVKYNKDTMDLKEKLAQVRSSEPRPEDKLVISRLQKENTRLKELEAKYNKNTKALQKKLTETEALAESQEEQFKDLKVIQSTNLEYVKWQLKVKEGEMEQLKIEHRENAEFVQEMRDKNLLQVEIQLKNSQVEVLQVRNKLERSQAEVRRVMDIVKEKEDKLEEVEAKLAEAQASKKRGRPVKEETAAKKRKLN